MRGGDPRRPRLGWVDSGRGLAIVLVALFHATNWMAKAEVPVAGWTAFNEVVSSLRMPLFFALSGMFAAKWVAAPWRTLWSGKLRLFAWVFVLWSAIGACAFTGATRVIAGEGSFLGTVVPVLMAPWRPRLELWFIWALALAFCAAKLLRRVDPRVQLAVAGVASAFAFGWATASPGWNGSVRYFFFFLVGLHARSWLLRLGEHPRRGPLVVACIAWLALSLAVWHWDLRAVPGVYLVNCLLGLVAGVTISRGLTSAALRGVGSRTLPVYLAHTPVILCLAMLVSVTGLGEVPGAGAVAPLAAALLSVVAALGLYALLPRLGMGWLYAAPGWVPPRAARDDEPVAAPPAVSRVPGA